MDRTMMDRTIIDNYRAEEKELSEKVYIKIEKLTLINIPTEEFKKIFVKEMFLKPNPKAFFTIMHYLFTTLDPIEFKKRFYWPIIDKRSETNFRSSTVDYLNYLNKKHHLQWTQLTHYLVQMPGGYKFLTFLNDFLDFIAGELVKQHEKYLSEKMPIKDFHLINFNRLVEQRKCLRKNSLQYCQSIDDLTKRLKEKVDILRNAYVKISKLLDIPLPVVMDRDFIKNFLEYGEDLLKEKISKKVDEFVSSEKTILAISEDIKTYKIQKSEIIYDRNKLLASFNYIKMQNPNLSGNILYGNDLNYEILVNILEHILPEIQKLLLPLDHNLLDQLKFEENQLSKMNYDIIQLNENISKYSTSLNDDLRSNQTRNIKQTPNRFMLKNKNDLHSKFINTPPIPQLRNFFDGGGKKRLSLMDDYYSNNLSTMNVASATNSGEYFSFANNQTTLMQMKTPKRDLKSRNHSTVNRSKIMDPSTLLRSLTKSKKTRAIGAVKNNFNPNLSTLALKWKEHESSFFVANEENSILETSECNDLSFDFNKTNDSRMMTTVRKIQIPDNKKKLYLENQQHFLKSTNSPKNMVVQQVQNTSLDFSKLSTSPSGRLESLTKMKQNELPKILLNDLSMNLNSSVNIENLTVDENTGIHNIENYNGKDMIFNVSDTILKNIPM